MFVNMKPIIPVSLIVTIAVFVLITIVRSVLIHTEFHIVKPAEQPSDVGAVITALFLC